MFQTKLPWIAATFSLCAVAYAAPGGSPETTASTPAPVAAACARAVEQSKPLLLEFSAPWCGDCRRVAQLKAEEPLKQTLTQVESVTLDVGRFDRHTDLLKAFDVRAIAHWVVLKPTTCETPPSQWPVLKSGTLEPVSGSSGPKTAQDIAQWLQGAITSHP